MSGKPKLQPEVHDSIIEAFGSQYSLYDVEMLNKEDRPNQIHQLHYSHLQPYATAIERLEKK